MAELQTPVCATLGKGLTKRWLWRAGVNGQAGGLPHVDHPDHGVHGPGVRGAVSHLHERRLSAGDRLVQRVLAARGLTDGPTASAFVDPKLNHLHNPSLMTDMDRAAERVLAAAKSGERIVIYGDYDVDGVTSTAILHRAIRAVAPEADVRTYVPHRLDEGYGLNAKAISILTGDGARVIVSVDCGVTAAGPALAAKAAGVDLIITDHHNLPACDADWPDAYAVVHPRRPGGAYPFGELSGAGVAYKLAWKIAVLDGGGERAAPALRTLLVELLGFAALGAIADVVPLVGENRVIATYGLARLKHSPFVGVKALVEACGLSGERVGEYDVGFRLAPRLNACGRMDHAKSAVELFTTDDSARAAVIASELERANRERQDVEREIVDEATQMAIDRGMTGRESRAIVLAREDWHAGVVGICCSRLVDRFCRPTILMHIDREKGVAHGSGRSIEGFNLHGGLSACGEYLTKFGGHDMAAGLSVPVDRLEGFTKAFITHANEAIEPERLMHAVKVDAEVELRELDLGAVKRLLALRPFGPGNPAVKLLVRGVKIAQEPRTFGAEGRHLELVLTDGAARLGVTAWRWGEKRSEVAGVEGVLARGVMVDAVIEPRIETYGGERAAAELVDIRAAAG